MLTGLTGKVMSDEGKNRPPSGTYNGTTTEYVYGADGARPKMIRNVGPAGETVTHCLGDRVAARNLRQGADEAVITPLAPEVRDVNADPGDQHADPLGSTRLILNAAGERAGRRRRNPARPACHPGLSAYPNASKSAS